MKSKSHPSHTKIESLELVERESYLVKDGLEAIEEELYLSEKGAWNLLIWSSNCVAGRSRVISPGEVLEWLELHEESGWL